MKESTIDLRNEREKRGDEVCREFLKSYAAAPMFSPNRHIEQIAREHNLTIMGVKYMLKARGIYRTSGNSRTPVIVVTAL